MSDTTLAVLASAVATAVTIFAPFFAWLWVELGKRNLDPSSPAKFGLALVLVGVGFLVMMWAAQLVVSTGGKVAPNLAKQGMRLHRTLGSDVFLMFFNMDDPVVGGTSPEKVALRRAIGLAMDVQREIRVARGGQAIPAQGTYPPGTVGYDPTFKSAMSDHDPARAMALLDVYGYVDRDGDGCRDTPDGQRGQHKHCGRAGGPGTGRRRRNGRTSRTSRTASR